MSLIGAAITKKYENIEATQLKNVYNSDDTKSFRLNSKVDVKF